MQELIDQFQYTQDEVAKRLGKSRVAVANSLRLLNLPRLIQDDVSSGRMSAGHARAILALPTLPAQLKVRERILKSFLTVRDVERLIQEIRPQTSKGARKTSAQLTPQMKFVLDEVTKRLATKVRLEPDRERKGGRIIIDYYTAQDLDRIYGIIMK
jgi:ParB family chromosome partitioning protein